MTKVRNITIAVTPELYRQTRRIAADSDTTVTELVRHILINLPELLRSTNHPAADPDAAAQPPSPPAAPASFAIPPSRRVTPAPQTAGSLSVRKRAAALRHLQRLPNH